MFNDLFPNGIASYLIGGLLIGVGMGLIYLFTGWVAGVSSFFTAVQGWWSRRSFFQQPDFVAERHWKSVLVVGLIAGAGLYTLFVGAPFVTEVPAWRLFVGGLLVGVGTRTARGCTSGHGICGIAALSRPSIASTVSFMAVGIAVAHLVSALGGRP